MSVNYFGQAETNKYCNYLSPDLNNDQCITVLPSHTYQDATLCGDTTSQHVVFGVENSHQVQLSNAGPTWLSNYPGWRCKQMAGLAWVFDGRTPALHGRL